MQVMARRLSQRAKTTPAPSAALTPLNAICLSRQQNYPDREERQTRD
jgi:hypothetical protein